jgi:hypothetical protein
MSDMPMFERYPFNVDPLPEEGPYGGEGQKCHISGSQISWVLRGQTGNL